MTIIKITEEYITLGQLIKLAGFAGCGAEAKHMILEGKVLVNNSIEKRRGKKLRDGDVVQVKGKDKILIKNDIKKEHQ
jgi:ribosome-associated protein